MRIIAGEAKGRRLKMLDSLPVRPTSDKVKGAVFNTLAPQIVDSSFLDLVAGSGSVGIEAWSRGASHVTFVEKDHRVYRLLQENLSLVQFENAECLRTDFRSALSRLAERSYDIIYADPPFQEGYYDEIMAQVLKYRILKPDGILCLEKPTQLHLAPAEGWRVAQEKHYGSATVIYLLQE